MVKFELDHLCKRTKNKHDTSKIINKETRLVN